MTIIPAPVQRRHHDFTLTMINIVFLLLLFFLTTGSLANRNEAQSAAPETSSLPLERLPRPLLLLQPDGSLFLDGSLISGARLPEAAKAALEAGGGAGVAALNILAQRDMPASSLLDVTDLLRASGVSVRIVTIRQAAPAGTLSP